MIAPKVQALAVSVHDVSPWTRTRVEVMLADLAEAGVGVTSLLVVPDHHHRGAVGGDPVFLDWLRVCQAKGHEIVLHGFYHRREAREGTGWRARWITEFYTAGEGEFYDMGYEEARRRMKAGREMLQAGGLEVPGFIAPAWLLGAAAERAATDEGFAYTTRLGGVRDLRSGVWTASQSLVYSVRKAWRRAVSLRWNSWLASRLRSTPLVRLGLHPPDWSHAAIRAHALDLASSFTGGRTTLRYRDWVDA